MKKILASVLGVLLWPMAALALTQSAVPPKFPIPWGNSAGSAYIRSIPLPSQIGIQNCAASLTDGFPPLTFTPSIAGGCPPDGRDFNGVLKQLSQWGLWLAAGTPTVYDSSFQSSIGGYPKGGVIAAAANGCFWLSTADNNGSNPETGGANWVGYCVGQSGSGPSATSTGAANAQIVTTKPFALVVGSSVTYVSGFNNTGPLQINVNGAGLVNVFRRSQLGATMSVGGETHTNELVTVQWDGTEWQCISCKVVFVGQEITIMGQAGMAAPPGQAFEDGSCVLQTTFADLFGVSGNQYGSGCSAGQFKLPDLRGSDTFASDSQGVNGAAGRITTANSGCAGNVIGTLCGAAFYQLNASNMPVIPAADFTQPTYTFDFTTSGGFGSGSGITGVTGITGSGGGSLVGVNQGNKVQLNGADQSFATIPPLTIAYKLVQY